MAGKGKRGPATKLTRKKLEAIAEIVSQGQFQNVAAHACGVGESTLSRWKRRGEEDREAGKETIYSAFLTALEGAELEAEQTAVERIRAAGENPKHWQASAWWLERKRKRWHRVEHRKHGLDEDEGTATLADLVRAALERKPKE